METGDPDEQYTKWSGFVYFWNDNQYMNSQGISNDPNNAMYGGDSGLLNDKTSTVINKRQMNAIIELFNEGKLNKK